MNLNSTKILASTLGLTLVLSACSGVSDSVEVSSVGVDESSQPADVSNSGSADGQTEVVAAKGFQTVAFDLAADQESTLADVVDGDKPVVLWGFAPHCGTCRGHVSEVNEFAKANPNIQIIGIGQWDDLNLAKDFYEKTSPNFDLFYSAEGTLWEESGISFQKMAVYSSDLSKKTQAVSMKDLDFVTKSVEQF